MKDLKKEIGASLQAHRKAAGYKSAVAYAEHLGYSGGTYTEYEQGRVAVPIDKMMEIAIDLGISLDELAGREPRKRNPQRDKLVANYEALDDAGKGAASAAIDALARAQKKEAPAADSRGIA